MRTLKLKKETLAELGTDELVRVVAAAATVKDACQGGALSVLLTCGSAYDACITARGCTL
jgi:hypothetical protein